MKVFISRKHYVYFHIVGVSSISIGDQCITGWLPFRVFSWCFPGMLSILCLIFICCNFRDPYCLSHDSDVRLVQLNHWKKDLIVEEIIDTFDNVLTLSCCSDITCPIFRNDSLYNIPQRAINLLCWDLSKRWWTFAGAIQFVTYVPISDQLAVEYCEHDRIFLHKDSIEKTNHHLPKAGEKRKEEALTLKKILPLQVAIAFDVCLSQPSFRVCFGRVI